MLNRRSVIGFGLAAVSALAVTSSAAAQRVSADIHIGGWPVAGHVRVGTPRPRHVVDYPRRIVVERGRWDARRYRNAKVIVVYYDRDRDLYYDRGRRGLQEIRVYRDGDRYYRFDDHDRRDRDRGRKGRYDDRRRDDRRDRHDDGRWERDHRH